MNTDDPKWTDAMFVKEAEFVGAALAVVNRFLAVYRDKDKDSLGRPAFHVIELVEADLTDIQIVVSDETGNRFGEFATHRVGPQTVMSFGQAISRPDDVVNGIRDALASNTPIPLERELVMSAWNHIWRNQLRLAVIEGNAAFESFVSSALSTAFPSVSISERTELSSKLQLIDSELAKEAAANGKAFSPWFSAGQQGWKALANPELNAWYSECYDLRNKVIHRGYTQVTRPEATKSVQTAVAAINHITSEVLRIR
ncbi:MAG: hypothetical protein H7274_16090 [Rhodoferax sp.]|nr:hypothetical protein [Rhodoferax sp.]